MFYIQMFYLMILLFVCEFLFSFKGFCLFNYHFDGLTIFFFVVVQPKKIGFFFIANRLTVDDDNDHNNNRFGWNIESSSIHVEQTKKIYSQFTNGIQLLFENDFAKKWWAHILYRSTTEKKKRWFLMTEKNTSCWWKNI